MINPVIVRIGREALGRVPEAVERAINVVFPGDPSGYGAIPPDAIRPQAEATFTFIIDSALILQRSPSAEDIARLDSAVRARAELGVQGPSVLASLPASLHEIWIECAFAAERMGAGTD